MNQESNTACWCVRREEPAQHLYIYECSNCGFLVQFPCEPRYSLQKEGYNYCPYCGIKMGSLMVRNIRREDNESDIQS